jgi:hypothetical protein
MNCFFSTSRDGDANLGRPEKELGIIPHDAHEALAGQSTRGLPRGYWPNPALRFWEGYKPSARQEFWGSSLSQQVHNSSELGEESITATSHISIHQVLNAEPARPGRSFRGEKPGGIARRRNLWCDREIIHDNRRGRRLLWMKGSQGLSSCGGWWAQPFGEKSCASLAVEALTGQANGQSLSLFKLKQARPPL